jgi:hypothetical protein
MKRPSRFEILCQSDQLSREFDDCDCACTHTAGRFSQVIDFHNVVLQRHPQQQHIPLTDTHSVVFVPGRSTVAVVNRATLALLQHCDTPRTLCSFADDPDAHDAVQQLYRLGLLYTPTNGDALVVSPWLPD